MPAHHFLSDGLWNDTHGLPHSKRMNSGSHRLCVLRGTLCTAALLLATWPAQAQRIEHDGFLYDGVSPEDGALTEQLAPLQQSRGMRFVDWLADGSLLIVLSGDELERLHRIDTPLGSPEPLGITDSPAATRDITAAAQPYQSDAIAVLRQVPSGATELVKVALSDGSGESAPLLGPEWGAERPLWAHDGARLAISATLHGQDRAVYLLDTRHRDAPRALTDGPGDWLALDWSLDDRYLLVEHRAAPDLYELHWLDISSGERRLIVAMAAAEPLQEARIAPDGRGVLYRAGKEWLQLRYRSLDGQITQTLTPTMKNSVEHYAISGDGRWLAYSYDDNGWSRLVLIDQQQSSERVIDSLPRGVISALQFDRAGARLAINREDSTSPPDVFVLDVASNALVRWTEASAGPLGGSRLSQPEAVRFSGWKPSGGGALAAALLYRPQPMLSTSASAVAAKHGPAMRSPVVIYLAGEDAQPRPRFDPLLQSLSAGGGFVVLAPELRGRLISREERSDAVRQIGALLLWIASRPDLDPSRVAIVASGRYSAVALGALALFSDRLQRGVVIDGDANGVPLLAIEKPVLLARGFTQPRMNAAAGDQLLWRLRAARSRAALFGPLGDAMLAVSSARRAELTRVILDFLISGADAAPVQSVSRPSR